MISNIDLTIRLVLSMILGGLIGYERELTNRPAGLRTHILVTVGSCLVMILSIYGFTGLGPNGGNGEPARLAAQVVSGIGFLGAGTIMREGTTVSGLTTAASIWICGGIGLAIGSGFYFAALITTVIALFSLVGIRLIERKNTRFGRYSKVKIIGVEGSGFIVDIGSLFEKFNISIRNIQIRNYIIDENDNKDMEINFLIRLPLKYNKLKIYEEINKIHGVHQVIWDGTEIIKKYNNDRK